MASIATLVCGPGLRVTHSNGAQQRLRADVNQALTQDQALLPLQTTHLEMPVQILQMGIAVQTVARVYGPGLRMTHFNGAQQTLLADVKQAAQTQDRVLHHLQTIPMETHVGI